MANINKISLAGTIYDIQDQHASKTVELTQAEYDGLAVKNPNTFYIITDAEGGNLSNYYTKGETDTLLGQKQPTLVSGTNLKTINNESLLGEGNIDIQGGSSVNVVQATGTSTSDVMSQDAVTKAFNTYTATKGYNNGGIATFWAWQTPSFPSGTNTINNFSINGKLPLSMQESDTDDRGIYNFHLVETSAVTTSMSSTSTDTQVPSAKAVYDQLGGLKLVKLTQGEYDALQTKDASTLYIIVN